MECDILDGILEKEEILGKTKKLWKEVWTLDNNISVLSDYL